LLGYILRAGLPEVVFAGQYEPVKLRKVILNCLSYLFYLGSELILIDTGRPYHLATLCVPEDSIVITTTFLRRTYPADVYRLLPVPETWSEIKGERLY
jgi:hypothetical protein